MTQVARTAPQPQQYAQQPQYNQPQESHWVANAFQGALGALGMFFGGPLMWGFGAFLLADAGSDLFTGRGLFGWAKKLFGAEDDSNPTRSVAAGLSRRISGASGFSLRPQQPAPLS